MNRTNFEHALFAIIIQALVAVLCAAFAIPLGWWLGAALAVGFFAGREYAQVEFKVRDKTGVPIPDISPWQVIKPEWWSLDARLDLLFPVLACALVAAITGM